MLEPLLLALQRPDGAQTPLLALTFAALTRVSASLLTSDLCEAIIRSLTAGLAQIDAADWASWVSFGVNAVPLAAAAKPSDAASSLVVAMLTSLAHLLLNRQPPLPPPQLEALLVGLQHCCLLHLRATAGGEPRPATPPRPPPAAVVAAQHSLLEQAPLLFLALLHTRRAAGPSDRHLRRLAPLALLSLHCRRDLRRRVLRVGTPRAVDRRRPPRRPRHHPSRRRRRRWRRPPAVAHPRPRRHRRRRRQRRRRRYGGRAPRE